MNSCRALSRSILPFLATTHIASLTLFAIGLATPIVAGAWPERYGAPFKTLDGYGQVQNVTLADLNGDGHLDIALSTLTPTGVSIRFGNGTPGLDFKLREDYTSGFVGPQGICAADMQGDGISDLLIADAGSNQVKVILRAGPGSPAILAQTTGAAPAHVAVGDLNHDGRQDVVTANRVGNTVSVLLGNGNGSLGPKTDYATGMDPEGVTLADLNGDGNLDVVTPNAGSNTLTIWFGTGSGTFTSPATLTTMYGAPVSVVVTRLNADAFPDIVVDNCPTCNGGNGGASISVFLGTGGGSFSAPTTYLSVSSRALLAGDFNRDGKMDILAVNSGTRTVIDFTPVSVGDGVVHLGDGSGGFSGVLRFEGGGNPLDAAMGDLNHDGYTDLVVASWQHDVSILLGRGDGGFGFVGEFPSGDDQPGQVAAADVTADGKLDLIVARPGSLDVQTGNGGGIFTDYYFDDPFIPNDRSSIAVADIDGDGDRDVAFARKGTSNSAGSITIYKNQGGANGFSAAQTVFGIRPMAIVAGDFNSDGTIDFATAESTNPAWVSLYMNGGTGTFALPSTVDVSSVTSGPLVAIAVGDLNGDGKADLVAADQNQRVAVLLGNGSGGFTLSGYDTAPNPRALAIADFDSDGRLDIAVACNGAVSILLGTGGGSFAASTDYTLVGDHVGISAGETNSDGRTDLVVTNKDEGTATVLLGNGDGTFVVTRNQSWGVGHNPSGIVMASEQGDPLSDIFAVKDYAVQELLNAIPYDTNAPPSVLAPNLAFVEAGGNLTFDANAIDPDGDPITFLNCSGPSGSTFTVNGTNTAGTFSWSPASSQVGTYTATFQAYNSGPLGQAITTIQVRPAGTSLTGTMLWTPDNGAQGTYQVCFGASNGQGGTATTCTSITVNPPGMAAPIPGKRDAEQAAFANGMGPARGAGTTAASNPVISAPTTATATAGQPFALGVSVSNATSLTINTSALPALNNATFRVNQSPLVTAPTQVSAIPNAPLTINVSALEPDGSSISALSADLSAFPQGNLPSFTPNGNNTGGTLTWTPTAADNGKSYGVTFIARNALVGVAATVVQVSDRPTAYYRLNGNLNEWSGGAPLQPLFGTAAYSTGELGLGSDFDGIASHAIGITPSDTTFDFTSGFTAECWVKVRSVPSSGNILMFARYGTQIFNLWPNWSFNVEGTVGGVVGRALFAYETSLRTLYLESTSRIDDGAFHHLAVTYDGTTINFYLDGVLQSAGQASGLSLSTVGGLFEAGGGARNGTTTAYLNGVVDEIRIWHVARTQSQIVASKDSELFATITAAEVAAPHFRNALSQNFPNPFNPETEIDFELKAPSRVALRVYDTSGRLVRTILDSALSSGAHRARWDGTTEVGSPAASGIYFYRLEGAGLSLRNRMVLIR